MRAARRATGDARAVAAARKSWLLETLQQSDKPLSIEELVELAGATWTLYRRNAGLDYKKNDLSYSAKTLKQNGSIRTQMVQTPLGSHRAWTAALGKQSATPHLQRFWELWTGLKVVDAASAKRHGTGGSCSSVSVS